MSLINAFPQGAGDPDLILATFNKVLDGVAPDVIEDAASRFLAGTVDGQSVRFAPSVAEFNKEARRLADLRRYRGTPRLEGPERRSYGPCPWEISVTKAREKFADWEPWKTGVSHLEWRALHAQRQLPAVCVWCATLATVFVPRKAA